MWVRRSRRSVGGLLVGLMVYFALSTSNALAATLTRLSTDTFTNTDSQHATEVEPDTLSNPATTTIVSAFQVGRFYNGGASDIGFATSSNDGASWTSGFLPGT